MTEIELNFQLLNLKDRLSHFALRLTSNRDDAKDLVQETLFKIIKYQSQFRNNTNFKSWAFTIMKNTFINNYRRNVHYLTVFDREKDFSYVNFVNDSIRVEPDSDFCAQEINKLIDGLDKDYKIPFKLHVEGYRYKEISSKLNLKLGTVKSRIFFARKKLMDELSAFSRNDSGTSYRQIDQNFTEY